MPLCVHLLDDKSWPVQVWNMESSALEWLRSNAVSQPLNSDPLKRDTIQCDFSQSDFIKVIIEKQQGHLLCRKLSVS